jgi:hypothetical protein
MALTLASGISASDRYCTVNQPPTQPPGSYYRIGDEVVQHIGFATPTPIWSQTFLQLYIARGQLGTTAASHLSAAALTYVRPEFLSATAETDPGPFEDGGAGGGGGLPSQWAVDDDGGLVINYEDTTGIVPAVQVEYLGDPADYIPLVRLGDPGAPTFVIDSSGDSDFRFGDSAVSTKWTDATNPAAAANVAKIGQSDSFIGPPTGYFQLVYGDQLFIQAGATTLMQFLFTGGGSVLLPNLPTADPAVAGQLWNDTGTLKVSAG